MTKRTETIAAILLIMGLIFPAQSPSAAGADELPNQICPTIAALDPAQIDRPTPALLQAVHDRNYGKAHAMLKSGMAADVRAVDGSTALMSVVTTFVPDPMESARRAAQLQAKKDVRDIPRLVDLLLRYKADPNAADRTGSTALMRLVIHHKKTALGRALGHRLLAAGGHVNKASSYGVTPLMLAASFGDSAMADYLISRGADKKRQDCQGRRAADFAAGNGHVALAANLRE